MKRVQMPGMTGRAAGLALLAALASGCMTPARYMGPSARMDDRLTAATGLIHKDDLLMQVGTPASRTRTDDGGEIWTFEYAEQGVTQVSSSTTPTPGTTYQQTQAYTPTYRATATLRFDPKGILTEWRYYGNWNDLQHNPFPKLDPFRSHPPAKGGVGLIGYVSMYKTYVVTQVVAGMPAARAGLLPGDQITAVNGSTDIYGMYSLLRLTRGEPGTPVQLVFKRGELTQMVNLIRDRGVVESVDGY